MKEKMYRIKDFIKAIICFVKQIWLIGKNIFGKKSAVCVEYRDLAPIDDVSGCEEHIKALEWAVSSDRIKNIALSGPYGSGKSSIIETFLRRNPLLSERSIKISLATFSEATGEVPVIVSENLEEGVLKQLFYKIKQSKIPQSRYRKLHKIEFWPIYWKCVLCAVFALILLFVFWPNKFNTGYDLIIDAGSKIHSYVLSVSAHNLLETNCSFSISQQLLSNITLSVFVCFSLIILAVFARTLQLFAAKLSIKEIKLPSDASVGQKEQDSESIFNKNMDEIVYFFEETDYRMVFIEDLDRFEDPEIFIQLRELNTLLNSCETIRDPIIFVYAIRDDMFKDSERTKFFDFIIPVIPVINSTNSGESLLELLQCKQGTQHDISRGYILDISPFISDMRVLQNIYNEFVLYKATLKTGQKLTLKDEQIMSLIVFKNLYPSEFAALQAESGIVKQAFKDKLSFVDAKQDELRADIIAKTKILESIKNDTLNSARELKYAMLCAVTDWNGLAYKIRINGGSEYWAEEILEEDFDLTLLLKKASWIVNYSTNSGSTTTVRPDVPGICAPYVERYNYMNYSSEIKQQEMKAEIEYLERSIRHISSLSLKHLIEQYGTEKVLTSDAVITNDLLVFLLRKGYINEEYAGCINYFKANSISTDDMNYILSIKNQKPLPFNYSLTKIPETLERLQLHEFSEKAILNFDLLQHMLLETHYDQQLKVMFRQLSDESIQSWNFINEFIDYEKTQKYFVKHLVFSWLGLWEAVYNNNTLTYDRKIKYVEWLLYYTDLDTLKRQNQKGFLAQFFVEHDDILPKLSVALADRLIEVIPVLGIVFVKIRINNVPAKLLDFIFENNFYILNGDMIRSIVAYKDSSLVDRLLTQNYTVITELNFDALTDMIDENWETYVNQNVLVKGNTKESTKAVLALLERSIGNKDLCKKIISHEEFQVEKIIQVCKQYIDSEKENVQAVWDHLLMSSKVVVSWFNVYTYWKTFSISTCLVKYIAKNCVILSELDSECLDDDFKSDIILSEINIDAFTKLLPCLRMDKFNIALEEIDPDKLYEMINNRSFDFTIEDYNELAICAPELCPTYILLNQEAFVEKMDRIELTDSVFESLITNEELNDSLRKSILGRDGDRLMTVSAASYLCQLDIDINRTLFEAIWDKIDSTQKKNFFMKHISIFSVQDFERYLIELGSPYDKLKRTSYRHDEFIPDTPENRLLVDRLEYLQYLTSSEHETQTVYGPKRTERKLPVIRCRVKVKPEEVVPTK